MTQPDLFTTIWRLEQQGQFKLIANADVRFPAMDFTQIAKDCLAINAFNLIGVDSPLPHYLLELAINNQAFSQFLIIFNEQLYKLFYAIWKAIHPLANKSRYQQVLSQLLGLDRSSQLLYYADCWLLTPGVVSLKKCLQRVLGPIPFLLIEYSSDWFELNDINKLGVSCYLNNSLLGSRFFTDQYGVECKIGPIYPRQSINIIFLKELLKHFAGDIKIKITLLFDDTRVRLGNIKVGEGCLFAVNQIFMC